VVTAVITPAPCGAMRPDMYKALTAVLLSLVVGLSACKRGESSPALADDLTAAEYNVLSAYTNGKFSGKPASNGVSKLVFFNTTGCNDRHLLSDDNGQLLPWKRTAEFLRGKYPALQQATLDSFLRANLQQALVHSSFRLPVNYQLIDAAKETSIFRKGGGSWDAFYQQYPGSSGIVTLSRVGFGVDGTQALFYFEKVCGGLCGGGYYVAMEKRDSGWVIGAEINIWVS